MSCGKNDDFKGHMNCVCQVVRAIKDIQDHQSDPDCGCPSNCFLEPLGAISPSSRRQSRPDTRVIVLSSDDGTPFHAFFKGTMQMQGQGQGDNKKNNGCVSIFFRVEDVFDNCCAVLRVLEPVKIKGGDNKGQQGNQVNQMMQNAQTVNMVKDGTMDLSAVCEVDFFRRTNDCVTVDLKCFCAVQCIADVDLDVCE
ncbi:spore coat protein CotZ [Cytobacillus depressus]|uniref:Spore coat protein CotZ n=1 Tax=Cytobacillus depressus TaxID=1602942 RepID=A0A6L3V721_9BACI|nr:CotY/CotZ family spore coat protein [Cytobacillus depressus]KAB2337234.1 spore coat protein CotZ [Cytobacillus depressus]